ncbi:MAG: hypothetical protein H0V19_06110 [Euzebyales bacterium]|nr:hypothetical protein [Euzebyales bacterium]
MSTSAGSSAKKLRLRLGGATLPGSADGGEQGWPVPVVATLGALRSVG